MVLPLHLCLGLLWDLSSLSRKEGNNEPLPESDFSLADTFDENRSLLGSVKTEPNILQLRVAAEICSFWSSLFQPSGCPSWCLLFGLKLFLPCSLAAPLGPKNAKWKPQEKTEAPIKHCNVHFMADGFPVVKKISIIKIIYFEGRLKHQWNYDHTWTRKSTLVMCIQSLLPCCRNIGCNHFARDVLLWASS